MKNLKIVILFIFLLALILRLLPANTSFISEENLWVKFASDSSLTHLGLIGENFQGEKTVWVHPPVSVFLYKVSGIIFNKTTFGFRIIPIIFGILGIFIVYLITKKYLSTETAIFSTLFMTMSFWHILASTQIDMDGSILTFIFLLFTYCFFKYEDTKKFKWLLLTGLVGGLGLMTKFTTLLIFIVVGVYIITQKGFFSNIKKNWPIVLKNNIKLVFLFLISCSVLGAYLLYVYFIDSSLLEHMFFHAGANLQKEISLKPLLSMFFFGTPLMFLFVVFYLLKNYKKWNKLEYFSTIWIFLIFAMYFFIIGVTRGPFERYLTILIPPIAIISGSLLSYTRIERNDIKKITVLTALFFILLLIINFFPAQYVGDNPQNLISSVLNFNFNINVPIMANTEPGIWLSFPSILFAVVLISIALSALSFRTVRKKYFKSVFIFVLCISLAMNFVYVQEYLFHLTHPNFSNAAYQTIEYYEYSNLPEKLFSNQFQFFYYLNKTGENFNFISRDSKEILKIQNIKNSTFIIGNYYPSLSQEQKKFVEKHCVLNKIFKDRGYVLTEIYSC